MMAARPFLHAFHIQSTVLSEPMSGTEALGRSYSLSPPARVPFTGQKSASASTSPKLPGRAFASPQAKQTSWLEKGHKRLTPWEAASRHPLGLVDEAFAFQDLQQSLVSNIRLAAQRKILPEPPAEWKARVSYQAPHKTGSHTWSQSQSRSHSRAPLPSFVSPTRSTVSIPASNVGYRSLPRQWQPQRSAAEANLGPSLSYSEYKRPLGKQTYKSVYTSNTWSWKRAAMSQFSTMTNRERKIQAAAICREIQGQEDVEMDLGKKVSVPKDIMLEELSFASNRGSRLFKMRQRRSEKFTYESIQNENNRQLNNTVVSQTEDGNAADNQQTNQQTNGSGENNLDVDQSQVPSDASNTKMVPNPDSIAPGYGGPLKDVPPEKFNSTAVPKSYQSPWEQAINSTPALADTLIASLPEPEARPDLPGYKSFNRCRSRPSDHCSLPPRISELQQEPHVPRKLGVYRQVNRDGCCVRSGISEDKETLTKAGECEVSTPLKTALCFCVLVL
ncbi:Myozenin-2 [Nibea albiflora]|uniref:Myozenin-2 n=1 Tax=Nibea albiflora TaxID=240163 RepID=A0ACB7EWY7_NIBAL|nr:Myozenin-2 [Nibea albiflora]